MLRYIIAIFVVMSGVGVVGAQSPPLLRVTIEPTEGEYVVYSPVAARSTAFSPTGQIGLLLKIENAGRRDLKLTSVSITYIGSGGPPTEKKITHDNFLPLALPIGGAATYWNQVRDANYDTMIYIPENFEPNLVVVKLHCEGYPKEFMVMKAMKKHTNPVAGGSYRFLGKAEDMNEGEYWATAGNHSTSSYGSQLFAYDIGVTGWNDKTKRYEITFPDKNGCATTDYRAYGKSIYAMADGVAMRGRNDIPENPMPWRMYGDTNTTCTTATEQQNWKCTLPNGWGGGNNISIHSGDEMHSYAHLQPGSIPANLLVPGARIKAGDYLGRLGFSGCSSYPHIHIDSLQIHALSYALIDTQNNYPTIVSLRPLLFHDISVIDQNLALARDPQAAQWTRVEDQSVPRETSLIWASTTKPCYYNPGYPEIASHGVSEEDYVSLFKRAVDCGYHPEWVDGYQFNGKPYYNVIFRYAPNRAGASNHKQTWTQFKDKLKEMEDKGYRMTFVDSYEVQGKAYFSTIYVKDNGPATWVTPNLTAQDHETNLEHMKANGWQPVQVSGYTIIGGRFITTLYQKGDFGKVMIKSHLSEAEYNSLVAQNENDHLALTDVNVYLEFGITPIYAAIWHQKSPYTSIAASHRMSATGYQEEYNKNRGFGLLTRAVSGYEQNNKMVFAAIWAK